MSTGAKEIAVVKPIETQVAQAEKPDREKLAQWAKFAIDAIPVIPNTESAELFGSAETLCDDIRNLLNAFAHEMEAV